MKNAMTAIRNGVLLSVFAVRWLIGRLTRRGQKKNAAAAQAEDGVDALVLACVTLAGHVDHHSFSYTGRNLDFHHFLAFLYACAAAVLTLVLDDGALTATGGTNALCLHHAENALRRVCYNA